MKRSALILLMVVALGCGGVEPVGEADSGPGQIDAAVAVDARIDPPPPPRESRGVSSGAGRVRSGSVVFDVEVGVGVSRTPAAGGSKQWESGSPVIP